MKFAAIDGRGGDVFVRSVHATSGGNIVQDDAVVLKVDDLEGLGAAVRAAFAAYQTGAPMPPPDELIHFVFDDHDFSADGAKLIGTVLVGQSEAAALTAFVRALEAAIAAENRPWTNMSEASWANVAMMAKKAYAELLKLGQPEF